MRNRKQEPGFLKLAASRRSTRAYSGKTIERETIDGLIDCARWAPSAHNGQPWRFFVLSDRERKNALSRCMAEALRQDLERDGWAQERIESVQRRSESRLGEAPVLILVCMDASGTKCTKDAHRSQAEECMRIQSCAAAVQNLLLAAAAEGIGSCWLCAPLFCRQAVQRELFLPPHMIPQALITMGYPQRPTDPPPRLSLDEIRTWI